MRKNFFVKVMVLALCVTTLAGCGNSSNSSYSSEIAFESDVAAPAGEASYNEPITDNYFDGSEESNGFIQMSEDENMTLDENVEKNTATQDVRKVEGIIMLQTDWKTDIFIPTFTVSAINPDTGEYHTISSFAFQHAVPAQATNDYMVGFDYNYNLYANYAGYFNDDYTKMIATKTFLSNEETHAGWVEQSGEFFDVTEALGESRQSDFDEVRHYTALGFTSDGNFIYMDRKAYYLVPLDNLTHEAVMTVDGTDKHIMKWGWLGWQRPTCWINDDEFLANDWGDTFMDRPAQSKIISVSTQSIREYIPGDSRTNWSGVISPDGSRVAFLSAPYTGTESPSIYITKLEDGAMPVKLETSYIPIVTRSIGINGRYDGRITLSIGPGYYYSSILEWR